MFVRLVTENMYMLSSIHQDLVLNMFVKNSHKNLIMWDAWSTPVQVDCTSTCLYLRVPHSFAPGNNQIVPSNCIQYLSFVYINQRNVLINVRESNIRALVCKVTPSLSLSLSPECMEEVT